MTAAMLIIMKYLSKKIKILADNYVLSKDFSFGLCYYIIRRVVNMEWLNKMNSAIDYIEMNITEKIDYAEAAGIACCSLARFQNMFLFITDITPSEYARRRRMVLSADELINSDIKINSSADRTMRRLRAYSDGVISVMNKNIF